jgi:hypothetical protein
MQLFKGGTLEEGEVALFVLTLIVFGGLAVLWMAMVNRRAVREMEHKERLAMIQRGVVPAPETDPLGFEAATAPADSLSPRAERWRSAGILCIGLGLALLMLLTFAAGEPGAGMGVGGAFAVLGGTLLFNSTQMDKGERTRPRPAPADSRPSPPPLDPRPPLS